jgi:hypothetical protein
MAEIRIAYEMGLDGKISNNKYRNYKSIQSCPEGRLETSMSKRDYMGVGTFFYCPGDPSFKLKGTQSA